MRRNILYPNYVKRILDLIVSILALPVFILSLFIISPFILIEDRGPVFYLAKRRGHKGKVFHMVKYRSMIINAPDIRNADNSTFNSIVDKRVTKVGRIIRSLSVDELPQILNIIKGEMSWVGPRASVPKEGVNYDDLTEVQKKRLEVKPGITGYSAAFFRNSISRDEKYELDVFYVDNVTFLQDVKIVLKTFTTVVFKKNIYTENGNK